MGRVPRSAPDRIGGILRAPVHTPSPGTPGEGNVVLRSVTHPSTGGRWILCGIDLPPPLKQVDRVIVADTA
jgi:hypothetical protein